MPNMRIHGSTGEETRVEEWWQQHWQLVAAFVAGILIMQPVTLWHFRRQLREHRHVVRLQAWRRRHSHRGRG